MKGKTKLGTNMVKIKALLLPEFFQIIVEASFFLFLPLTGKQFGRRLVILAVSAL